MRYEIYGNQDVTRWRLVDDTGRLIAVSVGAFLDKRDCIAAIKRIMDIGPAAIEDSTTMDEPRSRQPIVVDDAWLAMGQRGFIA